MRKQWLSAGVVVTVIGCGVASSERSQPSTGAEADPAVRAAAMRATITTNGRAIGGSTYRIRGDKDTPDFRVQLQNMMREHPAASPGADWNVVTGGPIHTTPASYSAYSSAAATDQVALAVDANDVSTPGYVSGASNNGSAASTSSLLVLSNLYSASPTLVYYSTDGGAIHWTPFSYLDYSFPGSGSTAGIRLYGLDTSGGVHCYLTPLTTSTTATALSACTNWTGGTAGDKNSTISYGTPYPVYADTTVSGQAVPGDIVRIYFTDANDTLNCLKLQEESSSAPAKCATTDFTGGAATVAGPAVANEITEWASNTSTGLYTVYYGDQAGVFYEVEDNNGVFTETNAWCLVTNTKYVATGTGKNCQTKSAGNVNAVYGSPALFNPASTGSSYVFVASGTRLFQFPLPTTTTIPSNSWTSSNVFTATLNASQTTPIYGGPVFDYTNNVAYVTTGGALYSVAFNPTISGSAAVTTLFKVPTTSYYLNAKSYTIPAGSFPLGSAFTYGNSSGDNWVFVNSGYGGSTSTTNGVETAAPVAAASAGLEQYAGATTTAALQFMQNTATAAGTATIGADIIDWQNGNIYFGYDNGWTSNSTRAPGTGGLVQVALGNGAGTSPTTGWECTTPYTAASSTACNPPSGGTLCRSSADCTSGDVCANEGSSPSYTCHSGTGYCTNNAYCTTTLGFTSDTCDTTITDGTYGICLGCTKDSECTGNKQICDLVSGDVNYGTCQDCDSADEGKICTKNNEYGCSVNTCVQCSVSSTCLTNTPSTPVCDTTTGTTNVNKCVVCNVNSDCTTTNAGNPNHYTVCDTTTNACVQCATNADCVGNPNGGTCNPTTNTCSACAPADGNTGEAPGNGCTDSNYPICDEYSGSTPSCGQCTTTNTSACPSGGCYVNGHCSCIGGFSDCPGTQTCSTSVNGQIGFCND